MLKFNMMKLHSRLIYYFGRRRELVDDMVCRAVLRILRERTTAELIATDTNPYTREHIMGEDFNYAPILNEFGGQAEGWSRAIRHFEHRRGI